MQGYSLSNKGKKGKSKYAGTNAHEFEIWVLEIYVYTQADKVFQQLIAAKNKMQKAMTQLEKRGNM